MNLVLAVVYLSYELELCSEEKEVRMETPVIPYFFLPDSDYMMYVFCSFH